MIMLMKVLVSSCQETNCKYMVETYLILYLPLLENADFRCANPCTHASKSRVSTGFNGCPLCERDVSLYGAPVQIRVNGPLACA